MRLATFNIRHGAAPDGEHAWPNRRRRFLQLVKGLDADILCLQEALRFQVGEIAEALLGYRWIGVGRDDGIEAGEFAPIFHRLGEPLSSGTFWLSECPEVPGSVGWNASQPRICTWAEWSDLAVLNVHLDHVSEEARFRSAELVLSRLPAGGPATIVCGDFNDEPDSRTVRTMLAAGFQDLGSEAGPTFNDFDPDPQRASRIDYVFIRGAGATHQAQVIREPLASDHWPLVVDVAI